MSGFTAVISRDGDWWIGWVAEVPGVIAQEHDRETLEASLRDALRQALVRSRAQAQELAGDDCAVCEFGP